MTTRSSWVHGSLLATLLVGLMAMPEADAKGSRGGHHAAHAPRVSSAHRSNRAPAHKAPKMPRAAAPARNNVAHANNAQVHKNNMQAHANNATAAGITNPARVAPNTTHAANHSPYSYTYGSGANARHYRAYGYGRGYRNRYNGSGHGYGRSQGNTRAIVSRLRSVHSSLARINQSYQGHRTRAMHSISLAIRQLSHRSMIYRNTGFASNMNNGRGLGNRQVGLGANTRRTQPLTQAQADGRMSQHLRTLQGINMQLSSQGTNTTSHARARGHVQMALRELNTALSIR